MFNNQVFEFFKNNIVFEKDELVRLNVLQDKFTENTAHLNDVDYQIEIKRLVVDLSLKSSQIEGNTSLVETERLLKDKVIASGKTSEESIMILNLEEAIDFIVANLDYLKILTVSKLESIHGLLSKKYCPVSFRTVDIVVFKKAMIVL